MQDHLTSFERYGEAVEYARRDAALDAGDAESLSRLGHALCKVGQFDEAAASFARALELSMHDLGLHFALVNALACAGRLDDAISAMHTTIARFPQDPGARVRLGEMLALQNQTEAAGNALSDALALDPANADAARSLANLRGTPRMTLWSQFLTHRGNAMSKWKQYFPAYQRHLSKFTDQSILLIEIGVSGGGSLQLWKQFLGPFVRIVGIDANEICQQFEEDQISVRIGGQSDCAGLFNADIAVGWAA
jgi:tetratricopeptide (TPR) repeat protein